MKNIKKSAFGVLSLSAMLLALASCDASRNTNTPTGNINLNQTYASVNTSSSNLSVTYEEVYNKFRSLGYSQVLEQLKKSVVKTEMAAATYEANYKLYNKVYVLMIKEMDLNQNPKKISYDEYYKYFKIELFISISSGYLISIQSLNSL